MRIPPFRVGGEGAILIPPDPGIVDHNILKQHDLHLKWPPEIFPVSRAGSLPFAFRFPPFAFPILLPSAPFALFSGTPIAFL